MAKQIFRAKEKLTGRFWYYEGRVIFGRAEYRHILFEGKWAPSLSKAKTLAKEAGRFRYSDDPAIITVEA